MIRKFSTYEAASFYVEEKRAEGYHATILNEGTGFLWGPRTVGGFRVFVSDHPTDGSEPEVPADESWPTRILRYGFVVVLVVGLVVALISALLAIGATLNLLFGLFVVFAIAVGGGYLITRFRPPPR